MWLTHMGDLPLDMSLLRVHFCDDVSLRYIYALQICSVVGDFFL